MIYLLDANVLMDANRDYYPLDRVPEFWDWLLYIGQEGKVKIPVEVYEEIKDGNDPLAVWAKDPETEKTLLLDEDVDIDLVRRVTEEGYAQDLTDDEIEKLGRDPFLIAHALRKLGERTVVTTEVSKPSKQRANKKVPNVCDFFKIPRTNTFSFLRALNFKTNWRTE